jgi:uncharacterized protein DUF6967
MDRIVPVARLQVPLGGQVIELQHVAFEGGMAMLRVRIREGHRFTVFDVDPATAADWACAMQAWARTQEAPAMAEESP